MVQDLSLMLLERLQLYQKRNGNQLPQRIIVFRDGVSEVGILRMSQRSRG